MANLFTRREANARGTSDRQLERAVERGDFKRLAQGVYYEGSRDPLPFEVKLAQSIRGGHVAKGELAAFLHGFDGFNAPQDGAYGNILKATVAETLRVIAVSSDDLKWEQALEWALRKRHVTIDQVEAWVAKHRHGNARIRRVLNLRPDNAPATDSLLETLAVQLLRNDSDIPIPARQVIVRNKWDRFVARVDLAWPEYGVFLELDGGHHKDQPRYDASRQTAVIAATGWLVGRYAWDDIVHNPKSTLRSIAELLRMSAQNSGMNFPPGRAV